MNDSSKHKLNLSEKRLALLEMLVKQEDLALPSVSRISPTDKTISVPLSFAQERLWILDQLEPGSSAYNIPLAVHLSGRLNVSSLQQSIGEIFRRHEVLRTTFSTEHDRPVQRIAPVTAFTLPEIDLSAMPKEQREARAQQLASEEAPRPFDLVSGPLMRATLLLLNPEEHVLLVTMHHIASDGWSMGILYQELSVLYEAFLTGNPSPLPEPPIQYADFAVWQKEWLQGENLEKQLAFWKEQLRDLSPLELPTDHPRPLVQTFHGAVHSVQLSRDLSESLQSLSRREGVTLFMTVLAAFQVLLHRYTGQDDIVVGTPIANRNREEIEGLIGFFVNTLVMRTDTSGNPPFRELLKRVRRVSLDAYAHQDLPFEKLVMELRPERDLSLNPLFQVMFALQNAPVSNLELPGLTLSHMGIETTRTRFDLEVHLWEAEEGLRAAFVYNTDLFDPDTIKRMAGHYQRILEGIVDNPDRRLSELPLLTEAERHKLLVEWNDTATDYPRDKCIHELFEEQVQRTPDAIAVIFEDKHLTYQELNSRANRLAHYLRKQGVGPEVLVGICVERSLEMVIGILGILKAGGAYVPLDPTYPRERLEFMIKDTRTPVIVSQRHLLNVLPEHTGNVICLDSDLKIIIEEGKENPVSRGTADSLSYVMYTSGSTGRPKGVCVSHRGVVRLVKETNYVKLTPEEVFLQLASISFDASTFEIWGSMLNGAKLVIMTPGTPSLQELRQAVQKHQITTLWLTAGLFHLMVDEQSDAFRHVRQLLAGGDVLSVSRVRRFLSKNRDCTLINGYGPTENTTFTCCHTTKLPDETATSIPIGRPVANTQVYVLDGWLRPVPVGVPGELFITGEGLAQGYLNQPELTAEKFIPNPFSKKPEARLYKSGDLVRYLPDGNIEFLGRIDNQAKIRGYRIELGEVEAVLGLHPSVHETVVIAREDQSGNKQLVAYVVLNEKSAMVNSDLRSFLKKKLPDYMIPSAFVILDALPLTLNGKVDRKALTIPAQSMTGMAKTFVAPRNTNEAQLTRIWEKVLAMKPIGVTDNFFELGGHSLLAIRLIAEIRKVTGKNLPVVALFQSPTVEQLDRALQKEGGSETFSFLMNIQQGGAKPPLFWMQGQYSTLLPRFLDPDQPLYVPIHQGLDGLPVPHRTVEAMAMLYLREIRIVQQKGPYFLGGYCLGGLVALEIAQQMLKQGDDVPLLFLVDPPDNCFPRTTLHNARLPQNYSFQLRVTRHLTNIRPLRPGDKLDYILRKLLSAFNRIFKKNMVRFMGRCKLLASKAYLITGYPLPLSLRHFYLMNISESAVSNYTPELYQGRMVLCYAGHTSPGPSECSLTSGGAKVHTIDGSDHDSIVKDPYVRIWAEHLNLYLRELQEKKEDKKE
jgi:amino acid adenylation domain-containing protein